MLRRPAVHDPDTADLRRRFAAGDVDAFAALAQPLLPTLYTVCLRITGDAAVAEDVAQESLVRALHGHAGYDWSRPFRPWMLAIAVNACRSHLRAPWWQRMIALVAEVPSVDRTPEERVIDDDRDGQVRRALAALPLHYREAVSLYHLDGMSYAEMARVTGATESALKQRVRRGTELLGEKIDRLYPENGVRRIK